MNLSKSRYCRGIQCKKMLWLEQNKPTESVNLSNEQVLEQGNLVHEVARYLFGKHINIAYTENLKQMVSDTYNTIESYKNIVITEASFTYKSNFCSVDILIKKGNAYEIYEVKSSTEIRDIYISDLSYQYYVLSNLGYNIKKCSLIVINNKYIREGPIELDKLFFKQDITEEVINLIDTVKKNIDEINEYTAKEQEPILDIGEYCFKPYECPFFKYCTKHIDSSNVFNLAGMFTSKKIELYKKGKYSYQDLLNCNINKSYKQVIEYELYDKEDYINQDKIKEFISELSFPIYFLDFETYQTPIPLYDQVSPYEKIPFQYSLHYLTSIEGELKHKEFLADANSDPRKHLAKRLIEDIPKDVCVLAYNMSFEKSVIKKLASLYPEYNEHLMNIHDNMKDLMIPFRKRYYYTKNMHGSYSIKYVLPALFPNDETLNYQNLELIHNGTEAMNSFLELKDLEGEDLEYIRDKLLKYCYLDTYAMVKIFLKLYDITK